MKPLACCQRSNQCLQRFSLGITTEDTEPISWTGSVRAELLVKFFFRRITGSFLFSL